CMQTTELWTF
nr:immunoglobulin light chain junction region [Macaca mulatta]